MNASRVLLTLVAILGFVSCSSPPSAQIPSSPGTPAIGLSREAATASAGGANAPINTPDFSGIATPPAEPNPYVRLAEEDLANRLQVNPSQIHVLKLTDIDWQDIQQGCILPMGQTENKGRPSGYRIWLETNGKNYLYHVGLDNTIIFCTEQQ